MQGRSHVGNEEGLSLGFFERIRDGDPDEIDDGEADGKLLGESVGLSIGDDEGFTDGYEVDNGYT